MATFSGCRTSGVSPLESRSTNGSKGRQSTNSRIVSIFTLAFYASDLKNSNPGRSYTMIRICPLVLVLAIPLVSRAQDPDARVPDYGVSATFSIVACDPESGVCGAAVASKYPAVGKVVPYVRAGVGAFCTQHWHNPKIGERALDLLADGKLPEEVLGELLKDDERRDK